MTRQWTTFFAAAVVVAALIAGIACGDSPSLLDERPVEPAGDETTTVTALSRQASELRIGMTTEEVIALLGPPSWAVRSEDNSEYSGPDLPLLLIWKNGNCNPVEVEFGVGGEALGWNEGRDLCGDAEYAFLPEDAFACPRTDPQFVASALSDACASNTEQVDAAAESDELSGWDHYQLAEQYADGVGVLQDDAEALRHYRLSAELGEEPALYELGEIYHEGELVPADLAEARRLWELIAEEGESWVATAMISLYSCYRTHGHGGVQAGDRALRRLNAYMWIVLALSRMDRQDDTIDTWIAAREQLSRTLTNNGQLAEAQRLVREWDEAHPRD